MDRVISLSRSGMGYLDHGDTPAFSRMFDATAHAVGSALDNRSFRVPSPQLGLF